MKKSIDQKLLYNIQTGNFQEDTKQLIISITTDNIITEFTYPRNKQLLKVDQYRTRSYHIPSTLIERFGALYISHIIKKIHQLNKQLKTNLHETKNWKEQIPIVMEWQNHINNLTYNLKKENHHQDILERYIEDRIHTALHLSFFHDDDLDTIHTIHRKIKTQIQELWIITDYIINDIVHNFEVKYEKNTSNMFRNEKKNYQWKEKYYSPSKQLSDLWINTINISIVINNNELEDTYHNNWDNINNFFYDLAHTSEDKYENQRIFPDSLYKIVDKKKKTWNKLYKK